MKLDSKSLPLATLRAKSADELVALANTGVKLGADLKATQTDLESSSPAMGKILVAMAERLEKAKADQCEPSSTSLADYFGKMTKGGKILDISGSDIREIIFGCWISNRYEKRIRKELERRPKTFGHVRLLRCKRSRIKFKLDIISADQPESEDEAPEPTRF